MFEQKAGQYDEKRMADIAFFAMVRNTCTKSEMPTRFSELYERVQETLSLCRIIG